MARKKGVSQGKFLFDLKMSTDSTINGYFQASVSVFTLMLELKRLLIVIIKVGRPECGPTQNCLKISGSAVRTELKIILRVT